MGSFEPTGGLRTASNAAGAALDRLIRHLGGEPSREAWLTEKLLDVLALDAHVGIELSRRYEVVLLELDQAVRRLGGTPAEGEAAERLVADARRLARDVAALIREEGAAPRA
jgi:hypothetical protein